LIIRQYFNISSIYAEDINIPTELVGMYGNADPLDRSQWLEIRVDPAIGNAARWNSRTGTCENALTSMNYGFVWSYVGAHNNPQAKVIAARLELSTSNLNHHLGSAEKQNFPIVATANFVHQKENLDVNSVPSPPVAISVPYDVWYPFRIDSSAGNPLRVPLLVVFTVSLLCIELNVRGRQAK